MKTHDLIDWLRLIQIPGLGPVGIRKLLGYFGHPQAVVRASEPEYRAVPGIRPQIVEGLLGFRKKIPVEPVTDQLERLHRIGAKIITLGDGNYPDRLAQIHDPPPVLYVQGEAGHLVSPRMVAVVGSRRASPGALEMARRLSDALARYQVTVVSGLALGVDSAAHRGALHGGGATVAVTAVGLDICYPASNQDLARQIMAKGCLITEAPLGTRPEAFRFPARNRIISGLVQAVVVVEAGEKSGALITSRLALEQGREVFAVPGAAGDWRCKGSNRLLREGAGLIEEARDLLLEMHWPQTMTGTDSENQGRISVESNSPVGRLLQCLGQGPMQADELARKSHLTVASLSSILLQLELAGIVIRQPGNWFALQNTPTHDTTS
ncbi:MAG: DNA-protecting protein DprA [Magnetococcales bacterium]|nr:DNA-protecting protein DprA [Magnetococcales bacterium]MBF0150617.1 DNA-protecting protein DprA [Magnetococcales bacterium]MBF0174543.1 DNA-protecting protein DprA [Magnetococcales bacterium]MBF0629367.1 DNA-protecting protein DprA [Magnetococcales bacterium]